MKKKLRFIILSTACLVGACLAEQNNPLVNVPTCADGIKNQNEEGIDCGGVCPACPVPFIIPCKDSLVNNRITIDGINYALSNSDIYCSSTLNSYYEVSIYKGVYEILIDIFGTSLPTKNTTYTLTQGQPQDGEASITLYNFFDYSSVSGNLYVTYANNQWTISVCTTSLYGDTGPIKFSGRVTCQ